MAQRYRGGVCRGTIGVAVRAPSHWWRRHDARAAPATLFTRTELFFGSLKPNGSLVSEEAFLGFLDTEITPRFPNGLTLLTGLGQFLNAQGVIIQEPSRLLILLYPAEERRHSSEKIEQIREQYKQMFDQESVLRADRCCELVGF